MSRTESDAIRFKKSLEKAIQNDSEEQAMDVLQTVEKLKMTFGVLKSTLIGVTVLNAKKKMSSKPVGLLAKTIISNWKKISSDHVESSKQTATSIQQVATKHSNRERKHVDRLIDSISITKESQTHGNSSNSTSSNKKTNVSSSIITIETQNMPIPKKNSNGLYIFPDHPEFKPSLSPMEVMQNGSFGGTYFRPISSKVTGESYKNVWKEFPSEWFQGMDINSQVVNATYNNHINKYKEHCGGDLEMWESSGWITHIDPYGWFQWYCRFFLGRRSSDDARQISRGLGVMGPTGRWRNNLINKCLSSGEPLDKAWNNQKISPKVRQLLQHWAYELTLKDLLDKKK